VSISRSSDWWGARRLTPSGAWGGPAPLLPWP